MADSMSGRAESGKGYGRINVDMHHAPHGAKIPVSGQIAWGAMEISGLVDTFQAHLQLPIEYTIVGVYFDIAFRHWVVVVQNDTLPLPEEGAMIPLLMPVYNRAEDGKETLVDLKLMR
jgi:hypothetical protein